MELPPVGTRVSVRYRLPAGSQPPLTDVVGRLLAVDPLLRVRTKTDAVVDVTPRDVVAIRTLTDAPVRTSEIRALEYAAALAWPGTEQQWRDGWLLRSGVVSGRSYTHRANSAVPLDVSAHWSGMPAVADWYAQRGLTPWLAVPDRLLRVPPEVATTLETRVMVRDLSAVEADPAVSLSPRPDETWLAVYRRDVAVEVLCAVVDGDVMFGTIPGAAVGRAAVTTAPDGTRWAGLSAVRVAEDQRGRGHARTLGWALLGWAHRLGATRAYVQVLSDNTPAIRLYESMGFAPHHRCRYVDATPLAGRRV
jgi:GNAT superfamily N-acetyltransferase